MPKITNLVSIYRNSLRHCQVLTREQELAALDRGDLHAIVESVLPLVLREARAICKSQPSILLDVVSAGNLSVMRSAKSFDRTKGKFADWSLDLARLNMIRAFHHWQRSLAANRRPLQIADVIARPESDLPAINDQYDQLSTVLRNLSENERSFLLRWVNGETMGQISQSVDLSRVRVHQVIAKAIKDIRTNMAARGIA